MDQNGLKIKDNGKMKQKNTTFSQIRRSWNVKFESNLTQVKVINLLGHTTGEIQNKELSKIWRNEYVKTIRVFALIIRLIKK